MSDQVETPNLPKVVLHLETSDRKDLLDFGEDQKPKLVEISVVSPEGITVEDVLFSGTQQ